MFDKVQKKVFTGKKTNLMSCTENCKIENEREPAAKKGFLWTSKTYKVMVI